jgi:two-component system OmpR family response regulator
MRLLVVEDDAALAAEVAAFLRRAKFAVDVCGVGDEAMHLLLTEPYDALILDLGLPGLDGMSVLKALRATNARMPALILTARDRLAEKAQAFRAGADDYVTKPFDPEEVLLRLQALIRRAGGSAQPVIQVGPLSLDMTTGAISLNATLLRLTHLESCVLSHLMRRAGAVVSRTELSEHIYELDRDPDSNTLEVIVSRIRKKIGYDRIETIRGGGYRLRADEGNRAIS